MREILKSISVVLFLAVVTSVGFARDIYCHVTVVPKRSNVVTTNARGIVVLKPSTDVVLYARVRQEESDFFRKLILQSNLELKLRDIANIVSVDEDIDSIRVTLVSVKKQKDSESYSQHLINKLNEALQPKGDKIVEFVDSSKVGSFRIPGGVALFEKVEQGGYEIVLPAAIQELYMKKISALIDAKVLPAAGVYYVLSGKPMVRKIHLSVSPVYPLSEIATQLESLLNK